MPRFAGNLAVAIDADDPEDAFRKLYACGSALEIGRQIYVTALDNSSLVRDSAQDLKTEFQGVDSIGPEITSTVIN